MSVILTPLATVKSIPMCGFCEKLEAFSAYDKLKLIIKKLFFSTQIIYHTMLMLAEDTRVHFTPNEY